MGHNKVACLLLIVTSNVIFDRNAIIIYFNRRSIQLHDFFFGERARNIWFSILCYLEQGHTNLTNFLKFFNEAYARTKLDFNKNFFKSVVLKRMLKANNDEDDIDDDDDENDDRETDEATMMKCLRAIYTMTNAGQHIWLTKPAKRLLTNDGGINNFRASAPCCKLDFHKNDNHAGVVLNVLNAKNKNKLMMMTTKMTTIMTMMTTTTTTMMMMMMMMMIVTMMKPMMMKFLRSPFTGERTAGSSANKTGLNYKLLYIYVLCYFSCNYFFCLFA